MSTMTFTMDAQTVLDIVAGARAGMSGAMLQGISTSSAFVTQLMRFKAPVGVTGALADSIVPVIDEQAMTAEIKPQMPYADVVERGSKPHMPPVDALQAWADMHGMNVWALAMSIKKKGTQPHPFIEPTAEEAAPAVPEFFVSAIDELLGGLTA